VSAALLPLLPVNKSLQLHVSTALLPLLPVNKSLQLHVSTALLLLLSVKKNLPLFDSGARGDVVVKALCYKLAGRGLDSRWCH
jgi:hypothetical protein